METLSPLLISFLPKQIHVSKKKNKQKNNKKTLVVSLTYITVQAKRYRRNPKGKDEKRKGKLVRFPELISLCLISREGW